MSFSEGFNAVIVKLPRDGATKPRRDRATWR